MEILVKGIQKIHVFLIDRKVKNVPVRFNPVRMHRLRDNGDAFLHSPAKTDLGGGPGIFGPQYAENIVVQICAPGQRRVSLNLDSVVLAVCDQLLRIAERVTLDLVDCRDDTGNLAKLLQMADLKVADANGKRPSGT